MKSANNQSKTLWIGDIESWMDEKFIYQTFSEYAIVKGVKVMRDRNSGMTLGYGFVEFDDSETAKSILINCNGKTIPNTNKLFKLNWASFGSGKTMLNPLASNNSNTYQTVNNERNMTSPDYSIYVGDLDPSVSETLLKEFFLKFYDSVISTKIVVDPVSKQSKGYGFVKFKDYEQSQRALNEMNGKLFINKTMKTNQAAWKKNSSLEPNIYPSYRNNYSQYNQSMSNQQSFNYKKKMYNVSGQNLPQNNYNFNSNIDDNLSSQYYQNQYQNFYLNNVYKNYYNHVDKSNNFQNSNINKNEINTDNLKSGIENKFNINQNSTVSPQIFNNYQQAYCNQYPNSNINSSTNNN